MTPAEIQALIDQAEREFLSTSISGQLYAARKLNGYKGKPYDPTGKGTAWGRGLSLLAEARDALDEPAPPPPASSSMPKHGLSYGTAFVNETDRLLPDVLSLEAPVVRFQWWGTYCDAAVQKALNAGVSVILVVMTRGAEVVISYAEAKADAERCAGYWSTRTGNDGARVLGYVFYNEIDLTPTWTLDQYADALDGHCAGVHAKHPGALAIGGGFWNCDRFGGAHKAWQAIYARWRSQRVTSPVDAVDQHTYGRSSWGNGTAAENQRNTYWMVDKLPGSIWATMVANGDGGKPIILGECGDKLEATDLAGQAGAVADALRYVSEGRVALALPYTSRDDVAGRFGIMGRPAEQAYRDGSRVLTT